MKCYLIDPQSRTIRETVIPDGDEDSLRALIGDGCRSTFLWSRQHRPLLRGHDALYTRDLLAESLDANCRLLPFRWETHTGTPSTQGCALGRGVVLGHTDDTGEPCSPVTPLDEVRRLFTFP